MDHHDVIGLAGEGFRVAGLLVAAVALVAFVSDHGQAQFVGDGDGLVAAAVVDENHFVHGIDRKIGNGLTQRRFGVVGRHDDDSAVIAGHGARQKNGKALQSTPWSAVQLSKTFPLC